MQQDRLEQRLDQSVQDRLEQSRLLVQTELQLLKKASSSSSSISSNFQEMLLKRLTRLGNMEPPVQTRLQNTSNSERTAASDVPDLTASKKVLLLESDENILNQSTKSTSNRIEYSPSKENTPASKENTPPSTSISIKKANRMTVPLRGQQLKSEDATVKPKVIHSPFRQQQPQKKSLPSSSSSSDAHATLQQKKTKSPTKPMTKQDLQIKFYLPSNNSKLLYTTLHFTIALNLLVGKEVHFYLQ